MAWSPSDLGSAVIGWWEARDLVSALADGAAVSSWADKSSAGRTLTQATAAQQPSLRHAGRHGLPAIRADGGDLLGNTALGSPFHGQADGYISFVFSTTVANSGKYLVSTPNVSGSSGVNLGLTSGGVRGIVVSNTGAVGNRTSALSWGAGAVYLAEHSWDFGLASNEQTVIGGDAAAVTGSVAGVTTAAALAEFNVLNFGTGFAGGYTGDLYAVLICDRPLTTTEQDQWRQYCYQTWGAVTHPFPPTYPTPSAPSTSTYSDVVVADGADLYWRLSEGGPDGDGAYDLSGNSRTGIYVGTPTTATGAIESDADPASEFDGASYVYRFDETFLDNLFAGSYSVEAWFRISGNQTNLRMLGKANPAAQGQADNGSNLGTILVNPAGDVYYSSGANADALNAYTTGGDWNDGEWHHVVAQRDASGSPVVLRLYLDGELANGRDEGMTPVPNNRSFTVGGDGSSRWTTHRWIGDIDEVALYGEVLTAGQVHDHHCAGRPSRCWTSTPTVGSISLGLG